jgi:thiol-disulfide isomerase/thioredoxin
MMSSSKNFLFRMPVSLTRAAAFAMSGAAFSVGAIACASGSAPTTVDPGVAREENLPPVDATRNKNPEGTAYPTADLGINARGSLSGKQPGNRMNNMKFLGYPTGVAADGLKTVALADFYDPQAKKYSIIHIQAAGSWCTYCRQEAREFAPLVTKLQAEKKIAWVTVLAEGKVTGKGALAADLDKWMSDFKSPNPHVLDTGAQNLGVFFSSGGLPWNAIVDARSMEILKVTTGYGGLEGTNKELDDWLAWTAKNAPRE